MHSAEIIDEAGTSEKDDKPLTLPFYKLLSQADKVDWILMALGTLGAIVHGLAQPVGYFLLGKALDAFGKNINNTDEMVKALFKVSTSINIIVLEYVIRASYQLTLSLTLIYLFCSIRSFHTCGTWLSRHFQLEF